MTIVHWKIITIYNLTLSAEVDVSFFFFPLYNNSPRFFPFQFVENGILIFQPTPEIQQLIEAQRWYETNIANYSIVISAEIGLEIRILCWLVSVYICFCACVYSVNIHLAQNIFEHPKAIKNWSQTNRTM